MNAIQNFFLYCAACDPSVLKRTPTEINKYVGIGATVFFTGFFAMIAAAYAIHTVFSNYLISFGFGLAWGLMIFNLDRYIVSTIRKKNSFLKEFINVFPRLILALLIAVVIAKPLELKVFETEIETELQLMQQEDMIERKDLIYEKYVDEEASLNSEIALLKNEITGKTEIRDALDKEAVQEADGTGGSMRRNAGPIYKLKKADADKAQSELDNLMNTNLPLISGKESRLKEIDEARQTDLASMELVGLTGLASRIEAQDRLSQKSQAIYLAGIFIMLLFIAIETAPIFVKLISDSGPYDYVLNKHEFTFKMNHDQYLAILQSAVTNKVNFDTETGLYKTEVTIEAEKDITRQMILDQLEKIKQEPGKWKELLKKGRLFDI